MCANHDVVSSPASRRGFLFTLGLALSAAAATLTAIPVIGYILGPIRRRTGHAWIALGAVGSFPEGQDAPGDVREPVPRGVGWAHGEDRVLGAGYRRDQFQVFAINCAHLGCPVRWFPQSRLFMCPCHGGAYYEDGSRASGPPPRGLFEYEYEIRKGQLWVRGGQLPTLAGPV